MSAPESAVPSPAATPPAPSSGPAVSASDPVVRKLIEEAVWESDGRFRNLLQSVPTVAIQGYALDGTVRYWNRASETFYGYTQEEAIGRNLLELIIPPEMRDDVRGALAHVAAGGEIPHGELSLMRKDGSRIPVYSSHAVVRRVGRSPELFCIDVDLTEHKRAEAALRASNHEFQTLTEAMPQIVWVARPDGWHLYFNQRWMDYTGRSLEDSLGQGWLPAFHPDDRERTAARWKQATDSGEPYEIEYRLRRADGTYRWMLGRALPLRDAAGAVMKWFGACTDIHDFKQAQDKLREQAALIEQARDPIHVRDLEHRISFWNPAAERLLGWTPAEAVGRTAGELMGLDQSRFDAAVRTLLQEGTWAGELTARARGGKALALESRWTLLRDGEGRPKSILSIDADVSERRRAEQQLLRAQRLESIGTLAGGIAHDLNNLLSPITIGTDLLRTLDPHPDALPILENMSRAAQRCADLVKQVLSFTRGVAGAPIPLQPAQVVREVESIISQTFPRNITVMSECEAGLWRIRADATQINQVLLNLCVNARDAMPSGGPLRIRARNEVVESWRTAIDGGCLPGRYVVLEVEDSGCGMPPQIVDRIFEPFFTTKELGKGTGLGLSTVLGIVRSHRGHVNVTSEEGRGSTFRVYLPALPDEGVEITAAPPLPAVTRGDGELILLVDDEPDVLAITKTTLTSFGYRVITAIDGAEGLNRYAVWRAQVRLVVTDMMMPVMDGAVLIAALRQIAPELPMVAASGLNLKTDAERARAAGARYFIAKPYSAEQLLEVVREALQHATPGR